MILSPNKKIQYLRKKYKITQKELCADIISTSNLSYIERGKVKITKKNSALLIERFNKLFKMKEIDEFITDEWLREPLELQIKKKVNIIISKISKTDKLDELIAEAKEIFSEYTSLEEEMRFNFTVGSYLKSKKDYSRAKEYFDLVIGPAHHLGKNNILGVTMLQLLRINYFLNKYSECELLYKEYYLKGKFKDELDALLKYNFALVFQYLENYKIAIPLYEQIPELSGNNALIRASHVNKGICLYETSRYDECVELFRKVINYTSDTTAKVKAYSNIISCARRDNNPILCKTSIEKLELLLENVRKEQLHQTYYTLGMAYLFLEDNDRAISSFEAEVKLGLDLGISDFNLEKYLESIKYLSLLYSRNKVKELRDLKDTILNISRDCLNIEFILFIIKRYDEINMREETTELIYKLYGKIKEEKE